MLYVSLTQYIEVVLGKMSEETLWKEEEDVAYISLNTLR